MSRRSINEWRELIEERARPMEKLSLDEQYKRDGINYLQSLYPSSLPPVEAIRGLRERHGWMQSMIYRRVPWLFELKEVYKEKVEETLNVVGLDFGRTQAICGLVAKIPDDATLDGDEMEEALETLENEFREKASPERNDGALSPQLEAPSRERKAQLHTVIGDNIDRHRKELGWSFDKMAEETKVDKKAILATVKHGSQPRVTTLQAFAGTFTKAYKDKGINRTVTVAELETESSGPAE